MPPLELGASVVVALVPAAMAVFVLRAAPRELANRALAGFLVMVGAYWMLVVIGASVNDVWLAYNAYAYASMLVWATSSVYLVFVSEAIRSRWTRPLRTPIARVLLVVAGLAWPLALFMDPSSWVVVAQSGESFAVVSGPARSWHPYNHVATFSFTLFVAFHAWLRAPPGSVTRVRARAYVLAFGVLDAGALANQIRAVVPGTSFLDPVVGQELYQQAFTLVFALLLARAMLKHQLFDFELKLKWTLNRGTIAAVFVAAFFAVSEIVSGLLSEQIGLVAGVLATAVLVFALAPLSRFADRVSDVAMPRVKDTQEYRLVRKREVYRAAVEGALHDGQITERERDVLARLADQLSLSATATREVEREAAHEMRVDTGTSPGVTP